MITSSPAGSAACKGRIGSESCSMSAPDYSDLCGNTELSDITIVLAEHAEHQPLSSYPHRSSRRPGKQQLKGGSESRARCSSSSTGSSIALETKVLPGHSIVLYGCSSFCKTKLLSWKGDESNSKFEIRILVPTGQLAVGQLLLQCMYAAQPDVSGCNQQQLLQLLLLADSYGVPKVLAAVTAAFASIAPADLQWEMLHALYELPPGCAELDACKPLFAAAGEKLQQELGDLELVWADDDKRQLLMGLPQPALLQLLQHPETCVSSENTVVYTIESWWRFRLQHSQPVSSPEALAELVRMQHCTPLFVATLANSKLMQQCFAPEELAVACTLTTAAHSYDVQLVQALVDSSPILAKHPAWSTEQRPASAVQQLELRREVPLRALKKAFEQRSTDSWADELVYSPWEFWQGVWLRLQLAPTSGEQLGFKLGCFMQLCAPGGGVRRVRYALAVSHASGRVGVQAVATNTFTSGPGGDSWGISMVRLGGISSWAAAESKLRAQGLVHSNGCLHLQAQILNIN